MLMQLVLTPSFAKAPLSEKWVVFYVPKANENVSSTTDFPVKSVTRISREKITDVEELKGHSRVLVIQTVDAFGKPHRHLMTMLWHSHQVGGKEVLTSRTEGELWIRNPGFLGETLDLAWQEAFSHFRISSSDTVKHLRPLANDAYLEMKRHHQLETGEYGSDLYQKAIDWSVGVGTFGTDDKK